MFSEIFYLGTQRIVTLILAYNTLCTNSLGSWLGISVPLYNIPMAKRTLNFQKYLELNPVVFINMLGRYTKISTDSYHSRLRTLAFAQFQWVSRKKSKQTTRNLPPFLLSFSLSQEGSRFSSGRSRSHYKQDAQVHCSLNPFQGRILPGKKCPNKQCQENVQS